MPRPARWVSVKRPKNHPQGYRTAVLLAATAAKTGGNVPKVPTRACSTV